MTRHLPASMHASPPGKLPARNIPRNIFSGKEPDYLFILRKIKFLSIHIPICSKKGAGNPAPACVMKDLVTRMKEQFFLLLVQVT